MNLFSCIFQIHDGPNSTSPAFLEQPRYDGGSWTRPVIAATSKYVFLKFIPGPTKGKTFVGFKASYWTVQSKYIEMYINLMRCTHIFNNEKKHIIKESRKIHVMFSVLHVDLILVHLAAVTDAVWKHFTVVLLSKAKLAMCFVYTNSDFDKRQHVNPKM